MAFTFYIHGELGNQMFQWATGISLSKVTGRELIFKVAPGYTLRLGEYVTKSKYLPKSDLGISFLGQGKISKSIYSATRRLPNSFFFNERHLCYQDLTKTNAKFFHGYFQSWRYFHEFQNEIRDEFRLVKTSENYKSLVSTLPSRYTAIHIRRGGKGAAVLADKYHGLLDSEYYERAIDLNRTLGGAAEYVVFTDNREVALELLARIGMRDVRIIAPADTFSQVENLQIMSLATSFIGANSSYSWWAAYLAKNLQTSPIFPRQWYMNPLISTNDLLPPDWISLGFSRFLNEKFERGMRK
jgi:hypothetical protein